jgi:hypothetical protein
MKDCLDFITINPILCRLRSSAFVLLHRNGSDTHKPHSEEHFAHRVDHPVTGLG